MNADTDALHVLGLYPTDCRPGRLDSLGSAGGFSGARFWQVWAPRGTLCLRRWPDGTSSDRLRWIHSVLNHVDRSGFHTIPLPLDTSAGESWVAHGRYLWDLSKWLPGKPEGAKRAGIARIEAALAALAQFHLAAATFPLAPPHHAWSPGIIKRHEKLAARMAGGLEQIASSIRPEVWSAGWTHTRQILELFPLVAPHVVGQLRTASRLETALQPCLRDIWSDHVLFVENEVTGIIDFGALRPESVAGDVARLLGSMACDDARSWEAGLASYEKLRPLSSIERSLVPIFDRSTVLLGGLNWIEWIYCEGRRFERLDLAAERLGQLLERLECLARSRIV